jgi:NAD(P)-dependent dehydrogenase (short-subunit alcohol dehydrogenase family)
MDLLLKDKVAIVTGAGRGIGRACAEVLAAEGAKVVVTDLDQETVQTTAKALSGTGAKVLGLQVDVCDAGQVKDMVGDAAERFGSVDILVNNAGVVFPTRFPDATLEEWDKTMDVNLKGVFHCTQAVFPIMKQKGYGRVVNLSSSAGKTVSTLGGVHYTVSKHGVLGLTRAFAKEAAQWGITCNAVCPGLIDTEMVRNIIDEKQAQAYGKSFPIQRLGDPSEVGHLVAFLASDRAAYITGAAIDINGGDLMV